MPRDSGTPVAPGAETDDQQANRYARYERIKVGWARITEIEEEIKALGQERDQIKKDLEKNEGVNRGGFADAKRYEKLTPAAAQKRRETFEELYDLKIKPAIDAAEQGQSDE